jgi:hypothetical protein
MGSARLASSAHLQTTKQLVRAKHQFARWPVTLSHPFLHVVVYDYALHRLSCLYTLTAVKLVGFLLLLSLSSSLCSSKQSLAFHPKMWCSFCDHEMTQASARGSFPFLLRQVVSHVSLRSFVSAKLYSADSYLTRCRWVRATLPRNGLYNRAGAGV